MIKEEKPIVLAWFLLLEYLQVSKMGLYFSIEYICVLIIIQYKNL